MLNGMLTYDSLFCLFFLCRKPVSDKVFDRELQEALQLSLLETGGSGSQSEGDEGKESGWSQGREEGSEKVQK